MGEQCRVVTKFEITVLGVFKLQKTIPEMANSCRHTLPKRSVGIS
jgi:hypothetical protein